MSPSLLPNESKGAGAQPWMAGGAGTKRSCNEGKTKRLFHFCPRTSANSSLRVSISCQTKSMSPEEVRDSFCATHSFLSTWAWEGLCMQSRKRKKKGLAAAAHTSSSQSQWADADEHLHKPQHGAGLPLIRQGAVQVANVYTHTHRDILSLSINTDIKIQGDKDELLAGLQSPAFHQRAVAAQPFSSSPAVPFISQTPLCSGGWVLPFPVSQGVQSQDLPVIRFPEASPG